MVQNNRSSTISSQLEVIETRLDAIIASLKDVVEAIKNRKILPITPEVHGNSDRLQKGHHSRSNMDMEGDGNSMTGDEVMGDDCNCEEVGDDGKDTVAALDNAIGKPEVNQNNNPSKDQHETVDVLVSEKLHSFQSLDVILLQEIVECGLAVTRNRLKKIGGLERDLNLFMEEESAVERVTKSESTLEGEIDQEKFMLSGVFTLTNSEVFKGSCKRFVLDNTTGFDHQWVSAAGYPIMELLIAWENYSLRGKFLLRLEDKSISGREVLIQTQAHIFDPY